MFLKSLLLLALIASAFGQNTETDSRSVLKVTITEVHQPGEDSTKIDHRRAADNDNSQSGETKVETEEDMHEASSVQHDGSSATDPGADANKIVYSHPANHKKREVNPNVDRDYKSQAGCCG